MKTEHPIRWLCEALEVSASGYYDWSNRQTQPSPRALENEQLRQQRDILKKTLGILSEAPNNATNGLTR